MTNTAFEIVKSEIEFDYTKSRGPGGQNVNKTSTAAVLRWSPLFTQAFGEAQKSWLLQRISSRLTRDGILQIKTDTFRDQEANRKDCLRKLELILRDCLHVPKPRKKTKPTYSSRRKLEESKKRRSEVKKLRGKVD